MDRTKRGDRIQFVLRVAEMSERTGCSWEEHRSATHAAISLGFAKPKTWIKLSPRRQRKETPRRNKPPNIVTYIPLRTTQCMYYGPPHRPRHSHRQTRTNPAETITNLRTPSTPRHICFAKQPYSHPRCTSRCQ